jgi:hypothetical protein
MWFIMHHGKKINSMHKNVHKYETILEIKTHLYIILVFHIKNKVNISLIIFICIWRVWNMEDLGAFVPFPKLSTVRVLSK